MKDAKFIIAGMILAVLILGIALAIKSRVSQPRIELPEEYPLISKDSTHPDILVGYFDDKGVLQIGFYHPQK